MHCCANYGDTYETGSTREKKNSKTTGNFAQISNSHKKELKQHAPQIGQPNKMKLNSSCDPKLVITSYFD